MMSALKIGRLHLPRLLVKTELTKHFVMAGVLAIELAEIEGLLLQLESTQPAQLVDRKS